MPIDSLIDLASYKAISSNQLVGAHNDLIGALNQNFIFLQYSIEAPIPNPNMATENNMVLAVKQPGPYFAYDSIANLVNVQETAAVYLTTAKTLRLDNNLTFSLLGLTGSSNKLVIASATPGGAIADKVTYQQVDSSGEMTVNHQVSSFQVTSNFASLTVTSGHFQVNALAVAGYALPTVAPTANQILQANSAGVLGFTTFSTPFTRIGTSATWSSSSDLQFDAVKYPSTSISWVTSRTGFGFDNFTPAQNGNLPSDIPGTSRFYLRFASYNVFLVTQPDRVNGNIVTPYMQMYMGLALASTSKIDPLSNPVGSLWYDNSTKGLMLITDVGQRHISSLPATEVVSTSEVKDFVLQAAATISVDAGSEIKPSFKVGAAGLTSEDSDLKVVLSGTSVARFSTTGISSANLMASATAKIVLDDSLGINNPASPAYTFADASGLGVYRSDSNAMAIAVKGVPIAEFSEGKLSLKGNHISNVAPPVNATDAATKGYVDSITPTGFTTGSIPIVSSESIKKYVQSDAKYVNGSLELGGSGKSGAIRLKSTSGGSASIIVPTTTNNLSFELPSNSLNNGVLQRLNGGSTWVAISTITSGLVKVDGSVALSAGLKITVDTSPTSLLLGVGTTGIYASLTAGSKVGFAGNGVKLLEADVNSKALTGITSVFNAPYIRLTNTLTAYGVPATLGRPTYAFAGEQETGVGQLQEGSVSLMVGGAAKLTANTSALSANRNILRDLSDPVNATDAATKQYVDSVVNKTRQEYSFRITSLPIGWTDASPLYLSIFDKALIHQSSTAPLVMESANDPTKARVPINFSTNADCQVYLNDKRLVKMTNAFGTRDVAFSTAGSIVLRVINNQIQVGSILTIHLSS